MLRVLAAGVAALILAGCQPGGGSSSPAASSPSRVSLPSALPPSTTSVPRTATTSAGPSHPAPPNTRSRSRHPSPAPSATSSTATSATARPTPHPRAAVRHSGTVVVLDPGHNGGNAAHPDEMNRQVPMGFGQTKPCNTTGTSTDAGYAEHAFTFDVSERVQSILESRGIAVYLTRPNDIGFGPCVDERAGYGNRMHADAVVAIHADGAPSSGHGFHVCTASRRPDGATDTTTARSHDMAVDIHDALNNGSGLTPSTYIGSNGYFPRSDLAGLNLSVRPTTFLELGNMRNSSDAALQSSSTGRQQIASSVAAGILAYLANP